MAGSGRQGGARRFRSRVWLVGFVAVVVVGAVIVAIVVATSPKSESQLRSVVPSPPPASSHLVASSRPYLRGTGAVIIRLHDDVSAWLSDPTATSCRDMAGRFRALGSPDAIDTAIGAAPDPILIDLGADEVSGLHIVIKNCAGVSSSERQRMAGVDTTLARRLSQLGVPSTDAGK